MTSRLGEKGQVVIPKRIRDQAGLHPGDEVDFELKDGHVIVTPLRRPSGLGARFAGSGMAQRLLEDRQREPR